MFDGVLLLGGSADETAGWQNGKFQYMFARMIRMTNGSMVQRNFKAFHRSCTRTGDVTVLRWVFSFLWIGEGAGGEGRGGREDEREKKVSDGVQKV